MTAGMPALTCRELVDFLADYVAGELDRDVRARFDEHLDECADCISYLRGYRDTIRLAKQACANPDGPVPPDIPEELVRAILGAREPVADRRRRSRE